MFKLLDFGYALLESASLLSNWLLTEVGTLDLPIIINEVNYGSIPITLPWSIGELLVGSGLVFVLGYKAVKFFTDIIL